MWRERESSIYWRRLLRASLAAGPQAGDDRAVEIAAALIARSYPTGDSPDFGLSRRQVRRLLKRHGKHTTYFYARKNYCLEW